MQFRGRHHHNLIMQKKSTSESGIFNPRVFAAFTLCSIGTLLAMFSFASTPATSTITVPSTTGQKVTITWSGMIPPLANPQSDCAKLADTPAVDQHLPTISVPANVYNNLKAKFTFNIKWDGASGNDEILTVLKPDGTELDSSDGGDPSETVTANNLAAGTYKVIACGFVSGPDPQPYVGTLTIDTANTPPPPPLPAAPPTTAGLPRYLTYAAPPAVGENSGEPSIGYDLATHKAMYLAGLQTLRVTFPENITPAGSVPEACDAAWEDVSNVVTKTKSLDPILFTDQRTGRTFVSQLDSVVPPASPVLIGLNSFMAFTDDDGATWTPAQINPPDASYDHQTVAAGPYPASLPLGNPLNKGDAVYYCAQAGVTAFCSRSDDGGLNFGRATALYTSVGTPATTGCAGIHGHVKVAPDGTVYVPNASCSGEQAVIVSTDAGTTWTVRQIPTSTTTSSVLDPSVAIASDGTLYFAFVNGDGHAHVAVSHDRGATWVNDRDIGAGYNLQNTVFVEAVAGDPQRAAVGFIGTTQGGDHEAQDFNGIWYAFIAHTYDGGLNWTTVNASPNGPVQREGGICNSGIACTGHNRNLLDFNEITMDERGRVLFGYADGCVNECEDGGPNSFSSKATIARQSGGKGLLAQFDPVEPGGPQRACLSGRRDDQASYLKWVAPDNGGSDITLYKILRSDAQHAETQIGQQIGSKTTFTDRNADPAVASYTYRIIAVNAQGQSQPSNPLTLTVGPRPATTGACDQPGVELLTDPLGDETDTNPQHDVTSVSIAEPLDNATTGAASKIYFTIKVANLAAPIQPGWRWSVRFNVDGFPPPDHPVLGPQEDWHVSMVTSDGASPTFTYGTTGVFQGAARFFVTLGNLDPASNVQPDGTITLVLPKSVFPNIQPGTAINVSLGSVRATAPSAIPGTGGTNETIPDTTGAGTYSLRPTNLCLPNAAPLAGLTANVKTGVQPLTVNFDGSSSKDPDSIDTIAKYTFNFDDGGDDVVQTTPTISHSFPNAGLYDVKLVVTDSRGKISDNTAHQLIEVQQPLGAASVVSRKVHGTTGTFDIDLPMTGTAGVECRAAGANSSYQLVYTFNKNVTVPGTAAKMQGTAVVAVPTIGPNPNQVTVNLRSVIDAQHLVVNLNGVQDSIGETANNVSARMDVLFGDVDASRRVDSGDVTLIRQQALQPLTNTTAREDIDLSGRIDSNDVTIDRQRAQSLPSLSDAPAGSNAPDKYNRAQKR